MLTQDRDARVGHIVGRTGKGYKLHATVTSDGKILVFFRRAAQYA